MKIAVKSNLEPKTFFISKSRMRSLENGFSLFNFKFYQKLFVLIISFSTILIFPETPRQLGNICESYNSRKICNVW